MQTYLNVGKMPAQTDASTIMLAFAANAATKSCLANAGWVKAAFNK